MTAEGHPPTVNIDVGRLVQRTVASLYSHLVTRPTGRAVRLAIETQLADVEEEAGGGTALSLIDLSEVSVLDFSCADEVVAKLLLRYLSDDRPREAFFVFRGVAELHRDPIEVVLARQDLATVVETSAGDFELLGTRTPLETDVWRAVEREGRVAPQRAGELFSDEEERAALDRLVERRLVFRVPDSGEIRALSRLVAGLES